MTGKKFRSIHKASRVQELPQPATPEGGAGRPPPIHSHGRLQLPARRPERERSPAEAGRNTQAPPIKERPAVGGGNPP